MAEDMLSQILLDRPLDCVEMEEFLFALAERYALPVQVIGNSLSGRAIRAVCLGDPLLREETKMEFAAAYIGGMEDGDWISTAILLRFLRDYCLFRAEERRLYGVHLPYLWKNRTIYVIPNANPDGMHVKKQGTAIRARPASMRIQGGFLPGAPFAGTENAAISPEVAGVCQFLQFTPTRLCVALSAENADPAVATTVDCPDRAVTIGKLLSHMASWPFTRTEAPNSLAAWYTAAMRRPAFQVYLGPDRSEVGYYYGYAAMREVLFSAPLLL